MRDIVKEVAIIVIVMGCLPIIALFVSGLKERRTKVGAGESSAWNEYPILYAALTNLFIFVGINIQLLMALWGISIWWEIPAVLFIMIGFCMSIYAIYKNRYKFRRKSA